MKFTNQIHFYYVHAKRHEKIDTKMLMVICLWVVEFDDFYFLLFISLDCLEMFFLCETRRIFIITKKLKLSAL